MMTAPVEHSSRVRTLRVENIATGVTEADLRGLFVAFGRVLTHARPIDATTGRPGDFVLVQLADPGAMRAQAALNGRLVKGQPLMVSALATDGPAPPPPAE